jgi:hypothetical protein
VFNGYGTQSERRCGRRVPRLPATTLPFAAVRAPDRFGAVQESFNVIEPTATDIELEQRRRRRRETVLKAGLRFTLCFDMTNETGVVLFLSHESQNWTELEYPIGTHISTARFRGNFFAEGTFKVDVAFWGFMTPPS